MNAINAVWISLPIAMMGCTKPPKIHPPQVVPHAAATWPWPGAKPDPLAKGMTRWFHMAADGSTLELFRFDFAVNPRLRFELYDQDQDDGKPFDNEADYFTRGVGQVTKHLNEQGKGRVLAAWNGPFFGYDKKHNPPHGFGKHVGPVFIGGTMHYNVGRPRWCFGVKGGKFEIIHSEALKRNDTRFDFGASGLQCLIKNGKTMKIQPAPTPGDPAVKQPVPCGLDEAGHIPRVDHIRTSRTSMAWSQDSRQLYLLVVNEPDSESASWLALKRGEPLGAGFTLDDLQRFWLSFSKTSPIWGAINSDGGAVTTLTFLRPDKKYELLPPRIAFANKRLTFGPDFANAPNGGSLMTFYVREQ